MISKKLKNIFALSIPVFIAHGMEEIFNGFYNVDWSAKLMFGFLNGMSVSQATFIVFQFMLWLVLVVFALLIASEKWRLRLMFLPAIIYIVELQHIWMAVKTWSYYPGLITAAPLVIIGLFFWKELIKNYKQEKY
ncbi:hypothetical protein A3A05_02410 [Candidatus Nomurabacteria bacterium RIFCSPLOWO2_01_FULL_41_12]|uniref:HXXEE domain-containing protein n=1 Tax=Candidatus Nomurabacteria bacterium RIFCSPLOWO2_01_FULL_41_12 TaxID=1801774 RepID=A0A1F6WUM5_9BACT|nr:MAG: hypothetical protein A2732_00255 [Candidatus Nomurabacteria bacterium RIFCSPHIGHO2_01_FULL_40_10]OGI85560.1 MAG: hypothetical protein A3A05_02410 [Candidatus Nomurabacteria bacterium RIFCSPLOWO2_01_FULL_41_12]